MKKIYKCEVDCANCAAKMERAVLKIDGVNDCYVNFLSQKFMLDAVDEKFDDILKQAIKAMKKVEPDCEISC